MSLMQSLKVKIYDVFGCSKGLNLEVLLVCFGALTIKRRGYLGDNFQFSVLQLKLISDILFYLFTSGSVKCEHG